MMIRKPNRRSGPVRVTQRGTSTRYPHPGHAKLARKQNRYAGAAAGTKLSDYLAESKTRDTPEDALLREIFRDMLTG
jgi:hypothetical protein